MLLWNQYKEHVNITPGVQAVQLHGWRKYAPVNNNSNNNNNDKVVLRFWLYTSMKMNEYNTIAMNIFNSPE